VDPTVNRRRKERVPLKTSTVHGEIVTSKGEGKEKKLSKTRGDASGDV